MSVGAREGSSAAMIAPTTPANKRARVSSTATARRHPLDDAEARSVAISVAVSPMVDVAVSPFAKCATAAGWTPAAGLQHLALAGVSTRVMVCEGRSSTTGEGLRLWPAMDPRLREDDGWTIERT